MAKRAKLIMVILEGQVVNNVVAEVEISTVLMPQESTVAVYMVSVLQSTKGIMPIIKASRSSRRLLSALSLQEYSKEALQCPLDAFNTVCYFHRFAGECLQHAPVPIYSLTQVNALSMCTGSGRSYSTPSKLPVFALSVGTTTRNRVLSNISGATLIAINDR